MRGTAARLGGVLGQSQSAELTARVDDDEEDTESVDVMVPVVGVEVSEVLATRFIQRSFIRASCRSSSIISSWTLAALETLSGSTESTHLWRFVDAEELVRQCLVVKWSRPQSDCTWTVSLSNSSGGDMLHPLLLVVVVVDVFDEASHVVAATDSGINSCACFPSTQCNNDECKYPAHIHRYYMLQLSDVREF